MIKRFLEESGYAPDLDRASGLAIEKGILKAYNEAKKGKTELHYVINFTKNLKENILNLQKELKEQTYKPEKLISFMIKDPKLRKISKSAFRDRIVHHALVQVIEPIFDQIFIYDSYANRIGKGTGLALKRFDLFLRKLTNNGTNLCSKNNNFIKGYALKADIRKYFENVVQDILLELVERKIKDKQALWLIKQILDNFDAEIKGKGMPLGNLTSQFFANIYLNELDKFIKHKIKVKYYLRYVDDFIILERSKEKLELYKQEINYFLINKLKLELHLDKSKIIPLSSGIPFVGFRIFHHYKILRKNAIRRISFRLNEWQEIYDLGIGDKEYYLTKLKGWIAYAVNGDTYKLRNNIISKFNLLIRSSRKPGSFSSNLSA